jgi:hypothetical protein
MAAYNKFQDYAEQLNKAVHNWSTHTFKAVLTNSAPVATNAVLADLTQISNGGGYTGGAGGGLTLDTVTLTETTGTAKVTIADEVFTASGASVGPLRYVAIYNDTATSPADALVCWFDYGSSITLLDTETFTIDFDATNGLWQLV